MALADAEKQKNYRARKKAKGLKPVLLYLTPAVEEAVKKFLKELERGEK